ncbi:MAG: hypothetical protein LBV51_04775 [Acholeplasmatales bacterium]|nr:hypothetical protein [Acholeplasmatales bacterium]
MERAKCTKCGAIVLVNEKLLEVTCQKCGTVLSVDAAIKNYYDSINQNNSFKNSQNDNLNNRADEFKRNISKKIVEVEKVLSNQEDFSDIKMFMYSYNGSCKPILQDYNHTANEIIKKIELFRKLKSEIGYYDDKSDKYIITQASSTDLIALEDIIVFFRTCNIKRLVEEFYKDNVILFCKNDKTIDCIVDNNTIYYYKGDGDLVKIDESPCEHMWEGYLYFNTGYTHIDEIGKGTYFDKFCDKKEFYGDKHNIDNLIVYTHNEARRLLENRKSKIQKEDNILSKQKKDIITKNTFELILCLLGFSFIISLISKLKVRTIVLSASALLFIILMLAFNLAPLENSTTIILNLVFIFLYVAFYYTYSFPFIKKNIKSLAS